MIIPGKVSVREVGGHAAEDHHETNKLVNKSSWVSSNEFSQSYSINAVYNLLVQNNKGEGGLFEGGSVMENLR